MIIKCACIQGRVILNIQCALTAVAVLAVNRQNPVFGFLFTQNDKQRMRSHLQLLEFSCAVVCEGEIVVIWVVAGYIFMDENFPYVRSPHDDIIAQVDVSIAVKLVSLSAEIKLLHPKSFEHLQNMSHFHEVRPLDKLQL